MAIRSVRYLSEAAALMLNPQPCAAMISITDPGHEAPLPQPEGWGALLRIVFMDAEYDEDMLGRLAARRVAFQAEAKSFPSRRNANALCAFLDGLASSPQITELYVHCHAGQRRSAAVAKYASELFGAEFDHGYAGYNKTVYRLLTDQDFPDKNFFSRKGWLPKLWELLRA